MPMDPKHRENISKAMQEAWKKVRAAENPKESSITKDQVLQWLYENYAGRWSQLNEDLRVYARTHNV